MTTDQKLEVALDALKRIKARDRMLIAIKRTQEMLSAWKLQEEQFGKEIDTMVKIHKESRVEPKPRSWLGKIFWP